jgi:hypothetical protein
MLSFKHDAVVVGRDLDKVVELQATRLNAGDGLIGRHPQFRRWPSRHSQDPRLFARSRVPTHNGEQAAGLENVMDSPCKARLVWNTVESICEKDVINCLPHDLCDVVAVSLDKPAVRRTAAFGNPHLRRLQQCRVDVDGDDAAQDRATGLPTNRDRAFRCLRKILEASWSSSRVMLAHLHACALTCTIP